MTEGELASVITRIDDALRHTASIFSRFTPGEVEAVKKAGGDPLTEADEAVDKALYELLPRGDEAWLSEESTDDLARLNASKVWVVDPLDGTKEFVLGIPEWCVSVGYVVDGVPVAGGIFNPQTDEVIVGGKGHGVRYNGTPASMSERTTLEGATVLGSRSESKRGEWDLFDGASFEIKPMGSVAYKLGLVACGKADATWTVVPKNEWDVAAGVALVLAQQGEAYEPDGTPRRFNSRDPLMTGLVAHPRGLGDDVRGAVAQHLAS